MQFEIVEIPSHIRSNMTKDQQEELKSTKRLSLQEVAHVTKRPFSSILGQCRDAEKLEYISGEGWVFRWIPAEKPPISAPPETKLDEDLSTLTTGTTKFHLPIHFNKETEEFSDTLPQHPGIYYWTPDSDHEAMVRQVVRSPGDGRLRCFTGQCHGTPIECIGGFWSARLVAEKKPQKATPSISLEDPVFREIVTCLNHAAWMTTTREDQARYRVALADFEDFLRVPQNNPK